ncbi:MAG: hypothetical protein WCO55_00075 [Candidatus Falkowbacteria bacterium]
MSTFAEYRIWAGVPDDLLSVEDDELLEELRLGSHSVFSYGKNTYEYGEQYMHGEKIGFGVTIKELSWDSELTEENDYDPAQVKVTSVILRIVKAKFKELGIEAIPRLYHHLDLGG